MKRLIFAASLFALSSTVMATDFGVSVQVGEPGFYGRIDIGNMPQPRVIYPQPVIIQHPAVYVQQAPVYMHVPPGHAKKWSKHCAKYNACGQPVYFVQNSWYSNEYVPHYRAQHGGGKPMHVKHAKPAKHENHGKQGGNGKGHGKGRD